MVHQPAAAMPWIIVAMLAFLVQLGTSELAQTPITADVLVLGAVWAVIIATGLERHTAIGSLRIATGVDRPATELRCACVRSRF